MNALAVHFLSQTPEWATPQPVFDALHAEFGFTVDVAATADNAKCARFYARWNDGLEQDWTGERVFCNPPYGREIGPWIKKLAQGGGGRCSSSPARQDRYTLVPRFHSRKSRDPFYQRPTQVRRRKRQRAVPFHDLCVEG